MVRVKFFFKLCFSLWWLVHEIFAEWFAEHVDFSGDSFVFFVLNISSFSYMLFQIYTLARYNKAALKAEDIPKKSELIARDQRKIASTFRKTFLVVFLSGFALLAFTGNQNPESVAPAVLWLFVSLVLLVLAITFSLTARQKKQK